jgi:hypothetical protein
MRKNSSAILLLLALFAALIALNFVFFVDTREAEENEITASRSSLRATPFGTLAFYTLLEESGYPVARFERPLTELKQNDPGTLVIIAPPLINNPSDEEFESLQKWVEAGGLLIIIDREIVGIIFGEVVANTKPVYSNSVARPVQPTVYARNVERVALSQYATRINLSSRAVTYHIGDDKGAVLADARVGQGRVIFLTDPYIVANNGIRAADNVMLALNLLIDRPAGAIAFDEYHHGHRSAAGGGGVMAYFRATPVPWMAWQGALIAALLVYSYGRRFARPVPLRRERRTTNLEFVSSMANVTRLARASGLAVQSIYSEFRKRLCRFANQPAAADNARLASAVARRAAVSEKELLDLLARCEDAARGKPVSDAEMLRLVTRIREIESQLGL